MLYGGLVVVLRIGEAFASGGFYGVCKSWYIGFGKRLKSSGIVFIAAVE